MDSYGNNVTSFYKINYQYGMIEVVAREVVITAGSYSVTYEDWKENGGGPITCGQFTYDTSNLVAGHRLEALTKGEIKNVGTKDNIILSYRVYDAFGKDVTFNYKAYTKKGTLTIYAPNL
jgi:hypothetical protein